MQIEESEIVQLAINEEKIKYLNWPNYHVDIKRWSLIE